MLGLQACATTSGFFFLFLLKIFFCGLGAVAQVYNPSTWEAEIRRIVV
jgi:hypothetical protein